MTKTEAPKADERWDVLYDVDDGFGHLDSECRTFKSYRAALHFAEKHQNDEPPAAIDHYVNDQLV